MYFVGNVKHHPLRRELIREVQTLNNGSILFIAKSVAGRQFIASRVLCWSPGELDREVFA
jgi:hypothetical protein